MTRSRPRPALSAKVIRLTWQCASLLLDYPDDQLERRLPLVLDATRLLPPLVARPLVAFVTHVESTPLPELAAAYVTTFDHQRRCCLYLTYFVHGDTRGRGVALLRFKTAYRAAGMELGDGELPDHLAVLLEFGATADLPAAWELLLDHRAGVELLRLALRDMDSPWAHVAAAVSATLPPLGGDEREAVSRLAAQGPPAEEVGLAPFAPPEYMPAPMQSQRSDSRPVSRRVSLPLPTFAPSLRGGRR